MSTFKNGFCSFGWLLFGIFAPFVYNGLFKNNTDPKTQTIIISTVATFAIGLMISEEFLFIKLTVTVAAFLVSFAYAIFEQNDPILMPYCFITCILTFLFYVHGFKKAASVTEDEMYDSKFYYGKKLLTGILGNFAFCYAIFISYFFLYFNIIISPLFSVILVIAIAFILALFAELKLLKRAERDLQQIIALRQKYSTDDGTYIPNTSSVGENPHNSISL